MLQVAKKVSFRACHSTSLHTVLALDFPQYLPAIFQGTIPRKIAGKYKENLKQASGEIFLVGRMKNFRDKCIENFKKWFLHMQLHVMPSNFYNRIRTSASKA